MNATLRKIAVSGGAAVALLGGATATAVAASPEHEATVIAIARTDTGPGSADGITGDLTPNGGVGAPLQNPANGQVPAGYNQQIQTQASGGVIGAGVVAILVLGIIVVVRIKGRDVKVGDAVVLTLFGIAVSGTVIGALGDQLTDSAIGSIGSMLGGL
ncbi:hypothetical protein [Streptomyces acidicola]|uniref:Uncharacterized protein n=1 Tax=Streptomyces acidicola TaxID=2596892 RepID=A0A5N8WL69_9ACTN|nr:hypothetical protein [Streptomyces acidicola]MPY47125.1 hypothetical protein [Streptomyces acidicola]MPY47264.1 hypothetical protein [Streptomyces acidicola]